MTVDQAQRWMTEPPDWPAGYWHQGMFWSTCYGRVVATADGRVHAISPDRAELVGQMARIADGAPDVPDGGLTELLPDRRWRVVHYDFLARLTVFLAIVLLPTGRLLRELKSSGLERSDASRLMA